MTNVARLLALIGLVLGLTVAPAFGDANESAVRRVAQASIAAGNSHTCALLTTGTVRCWGQGAHGALGYANTDDIGDDEPPGSAGNLALGGKAIAIAAGEYHTCALLLGGYVRCWGMGAGGRLGYGNTKSIGDNETPRSAGNVRIGGRAVAIAAGGAHTCALLRSAAVRCWGSGSAGQLGYGNTRAIGDNERPISAGKVRVGGRVTAITTGAYHTCALVRGGRVRCWGAGASGRLGYGSEASIGDNERPASAGNVRIGGRARAISAGARHTCALLRSRAIRCWGDGNDGRLGYASERTIGDDENPASVGRVRLGRKADSVAAGAFHTCAVVKSRRVRCWGLGAAGALGYGTVRDIGDNERPASAGNIAVGGKSVAVTTGRNHTCALSPGGALHCWGWNSLGQLGHGDTTTIGDDESPASRASLAVGGTIRTHARTTLTVRPTPRRDRTAPYVYRLRGRINGRFGSDPATCSGKVRFVAKRAGAVVVRRKTRVEGNCSYARKLKIKRSQLPVRRRTRLVITARFAGTANLSPSSARVWVFAH